MLDGFAQRLPGRRIPNPRGFVPRCSYHTPAVWTKLRGNDRTFMCERPSQWLARLHIPDPRGFVLRCRDHSLAVRTNREGTEPHLGLKPYGQAYREAAQ